jgi:hypothetical protein
VRAIGRPLRVEDVGVHAEEPVGGPEALEPPVAPEEHLRGVAGRRVLERAVGQVETERREREEEVGVLEDRQGRAVERLEHRLGRVLLEREAPDDAVDARDHERRRHPVARHVPDAEVEPAVGHHARVEVVAPDVRARDVLHRDLAVRRHEARGDERALDRLREPHLREHELLALLEGLALRGLREERLLGLLEVLLRGEHGVVRALDLARHALLLLLREDPHAPGGAEDHRPRDGRGQAGENEPRRRPRRQRERGDRHREHEPEPEGRVPPDVVRGLVRERPEEGPQEAARRDGRRRGRVRRVHG